VRETPPESFYGVDDAELDGPSGSLIRAVGLIAPTGVRAWAVLYRSTGHDGAIVPVSGLVFAPAREENAGSSPIPGGIGHPIIAWAHGTTGLADACAPSRGGAVGLGYEPLLDLVRSGFVVTATDYEGLGTAGIHPYLVGSSEGRSVLDSIRAAQALADAGAGERAAIVGISQGGHAALWAAELVDRYAPELDVAGVVAASPPMDLRAVQREVLGRDDVGEAAWLESLMVAAAWRRAYDAPFDGLLTDEALGIVHRLEDECPWAIPAPSRNPFRVDPRELPEWQALLEANSPGQQAARPPILVLAATEDVLVPPSTIPVGVDRLRAAGSSVELRWVDGPHEATLADPIGAAMAMSWTIDRLEGRP
jgi:pimeloyl-ACP methyl ester carboxylesterase